jgi:hypothetical protein
MGVADRYTNRTPLAILTISFMMSGIFLTSLSEVVRIIYIYIYVWILMGAATG